MSGIITRSTLAKGTAGNKIVVRTNSFPITHLPRANFSRYEVFIRAKVPNPKSKRKDGEVPSRLAVEVMNKLMTYVATDVFSGHEIFDGQRILFSAHPLNFQGSDAKTFDVSMGDPPSDRNTYVVRMALVGNVGPQDLNELMAAGVVFSGGGELPDRFKSAIQFLNIILRQHAVLNHPAHDRRSVYHEAGKKDIDGGLQIWRGYFQSVRPSIGRLLVNVDISSAIMYPAVGLMQLVQMHLKISDGRRLEELGVAPTMELHWRKLKTFLKGLRVEVGKTRSGTARIKSIQGLEPRAGHYQFDKDGEVMTVMHYFQRIKNRSLTHPNIPGIRVGRGDVIPFELCTVVPNQIYRKVIREKEVSTQVLNFMNRKPADRLKEIEKGYNAMNYGDSPFIRNAGLAISRNPLDVAGRVLNPISMIYNNEKMNVRDGKWNLKGRTFFKPAQIQSWAIVCFDPRLRDDTIIQFRHNLVKCLQDRGIGIHVENPGFYKYPGQGDPSEALTESGKRAVGQYAQMLNAKPADHIYGHIRPSIIIIILPDSAAEIRRAVKQWGDITRDTPTQCVKIGKLPGNDQYLNNLAMKINVKLGGINAIPQSANLEGFMKTGLIVGADVTHPGPGLLRPSVAGLVSSIDAFAIRYAAECSVQPPRVEVIVSLKEMMIKAILGSHAIPSRILFFRDGLSEGEYGRVALDEISQIHAASKEVWTEKKLSVPLPKITFVVVGKRHHVRFFPHSNQGDNTGNCPAGLVVDSDITSPFVFDYFLQSHSGLLGTSRPSHYIVIKDENGFTADSLQEMSYTLCHSYARATRSVSIPAPVYYADLVCSRADIHFRPDLNYAEDDSTDGGTIDMDKWHSGFAKAMSGQRRKMYFM
ncbi:Piwi-domain-containing protein [Rickenella mellea]|uniref:Piwi-domain-containing protein n=1 Tax=Rickenella mellea TaxID=50990 RepID=A0A4Y7Q5B4_9AGAM|nr:Piwi-domain-containing protein [Rickenella mellea]